jgi:hypothetical protein
MVCRCAGARPRPGRVEAQQGQPATGGCPRPCCRLPRPPSAAYRAARASVAGAATGRAPGGRSGPHESHAPQRSPDPCPVPQNPREHPCAALCRPWARGRPVPVRRSGDRPGGSRTGPRGEPLVPVAGRSPSALPSVEPTGFIESPRRGVRIALTCAFLLRVHRVSAPSPEWVTGREPLQTDG